MHVINTDTNAIVGLWPIPVGECELPVEGSIAVYCTTTNANVSIGGGDTLIIWRTGFAVYEGVHPWEMFALGLWLVVGVFGLLAIARRYARQLTGGAVKEV